MSELKESTERSNHWEARLTLRRQDLDVTKDIVATHSFMADMLTGLAWERAAPQSTGEDRSQAVTGRQEEPTPEC